MRFEIFRNFPWRWALWWLLLPNLAFIAMWPVGGPGMTAPIAVCGVAAVLLSNWNHHVLRTLVAVFLFCFNVLSYIAMSFNLNMRTMLGSIQFAGELDPQRSPEYLVGGVLLSLSLVILIAIASRIPPLKTREQKFLALGLVALLINADSIATAGTRGSYSMTAPDGASVDSAAIQNRIAPAQVRARNLVVIVVESWGVSADPFDRAVFAQLWNPARWSERYAVTQGTNAYFGSTTSAELRELCATWSDYQSYDFGHSRCLPQKFRDAGFRTTSLHSFNGTFFNRAAWYPKIGFERMLFAEDILRLGATQCGSVFSGVCDRDVPRIIGQILRQSPQERQLVYWLTVNSHIPVDADKALGTHRCRLGNAEWREKFPMLCRSFELQRQLADSITQEIMKPDFPETDILIVGDHMPPYFQRNLRTRFDPAHVPWIMLRNRHAMESEAAPIGETAT